MRQDVVAALLIERRQRLVHDQELGIAEERPPDRDPLGLPARQVPRAAVEQGPEPQQADHLVEGAGPGAAAPAGAEAQVGPDVHVREEPRLLEDVADPPPFRGHRHAPRAVEQDRFPDRDPAVVGADQAGDHVGDGRLAGAGGAEQAGDAAARQPHADVEREGSLPVGEGDVDHGPPPA